MKEHILGWSAAGIALLLVALAPLMPANTASADMASSTPSATTTSMGSGILTAAVATSTAMSAATGTLAGSIATTSTGTVGDITICGRPGTENFNVCYYQGQNFETFRVQRNDPRIDFDWGTGSPDPALQSDNFSARWLGLFTFDSGLYEFTVTTDDAVRLNVDNQNIIDQWHDQPATTYTVQKNMTAGQHGVIVNYYENWGQAVIKVSWRKVSGTTGTSTPPTPDSTASYYPNAYPSAWYLLPGQQLSFSGSGFAPNENVTIQGDTVNTSITADGSGRVSANNVLTIPYSWATSQRTFMVTGSISNGNVTPKPITIQIGTFYPQLNPSSWWIGYRQNMSVSVMSFAPGEQVKLLVNGTQAGQTAADGSGNATMNFTTPGSGSSATLTAQGLSSGLSSTHTIYLHP